MKQETIDLQTTTARLNQALNGVGITSEKTQKAVYNNADAYYQLGFQGSEAISAMGTLVTATGNVEQANKLMAMSADLARYKTISMEDAAKILARGTQGSAKAFKELGITLDTTIPKNQAITKAFDQLNSKIGGQAQAYTKTFAGQMDILKERFDQVFQTIASKVLPVLSAFLGYISANGRALLVYGGIVLSVMAVIKTYGITMAAIKSIQQAYAFWTYAQAASTNVFKFAMYGLNAAIKANPIGFLVTALVALGVAFVWAWNKFQGFRNAITTGIQIVINGFGYLVGAYCAEGCMTKHQISIANNDDEYLKPIERWCENHNITTKVYTHKDKIQEGWTSQDIRIYNTVLCKILSTLCGNLSHNKFVSDKIVFSNRDCILGFLDAYIGGDGCIHQHSRTNGNKRSESIGITSVSQNLLMNVQIMLKNIGVIGKIYKPKRTEKNNRGTLSENIKQHYELVIANQQGQMLAKLLNLKPNNKQTKSLQLLSETFKYEYCHSDTKVPNIIDGILTMEDRKERFSDIEFDQIVSIEEVSNTTNYAYDLTVEDTRTFDIYNGLCLFDTFHLAGVASKSNVTRGVPRIEEILRLTKNPKHPSLTIHLKPIDEAEQDKATKYANMLQHTKLVDVIKSVQICFDPNDKTTTVVDDRILMEQFYEFEDLIEDCL
jgi:hypothetical protein